MGGMLAWVGGAAFLDGFLYVTSNLLQMSTPLTDFNPANTIGVIIDVYVSIVALLSFGVMLNLVNVFQIPLAIHESIERWITTNSFFVPFIALALVIPFSISALAVIFGCILGGFEGWPLKDGILYVFSNLLGLGTALTPVVPETIGGGIFDIVISTMALGCVAIFIDYVTVLNPARYFRKRFQEFLVQRGTPQLKQPPSAHPLDYGNNNDARLTPKFGAAMGATPQTQSSAPACNGNTNDEIESRIPSQTDDGMSLDSSPLSEAVSKPAPGTGDDMVRNRYYITM